MNINQHTKINEDGKAVPRHEFRTCEICNIYWGKKFDIDILTRWIEEYESQGKEFLKNKLKDPKTKARIMING